MLRYALLIWACAFGVQVVSADPVRPGRWDVSVDKDPITDAKLVSLGLTSPEDTGFLMFRCERGDIFAVIAFTGESFDRSDWFVVNYRVNELPSSHFGAMATGRVRGTSGVIMSRPETPKASAIVPFLDSIFKESDDGTPDGKPVKIRIRAESVGMTPSDLRFVAHGSRKAIRSFTTSCGFSLDTN